MGKYDPLKSFLEAQAAERVPMTFADIERLVGAPLPKSKQYPAWWSNNPSNNTMTQAWLDAGFTTEQVDPAGEKLVFRRVEPRAGAQTGWLDRLRAKMAGTVRVAPGWDLTNPTGEIWDAERE
jgi:YD repeat-containing protein